MTPAPLAAPPGAAAYVDCFSGVSGDMFLAALIDAGLPLAHLFDTLRLLDLDGYEIEAGSDTKHSAIRATRIEVKASGRPPHRDWRTIADLLGASRLPEPIAARSLAIFRVLAEAEAKVHGCPLDAVHFHEVGAVDSIVDIVGAAIGLDYFRIQRLTCSALPMPSGWVGSAHGPLPLPAPAVCELLRAVPVYGEDCDQELVTPTGAAICKAMATNFGPLPAMTISRVGYGAGSRQRPDGRPNLLRLLIGQARQVPEAQVVTVIETNLDDWSPETFPYLSERLFAAGALDVCLIPIQMKKGRPGFTVQVIAPQALVHGLQDLLLSETSAIGLRFRQEQRRTLPRALGSLPTELGLVRVKRIDGPHGPRLTPEYEDCRRLAIETGVAIGEIYRAVAAQPVANFRPDPVPEAGQHRHQPHG